MRLPDRKSLSHEVHRIAGQSTIVFVTVCTLGRHPWLASARVHDLLVQHWGDARAWLVGRYVILPDHIHLFAAPGEIDLPLDNWVRYWKSLFSRSYNEPSCRWESRFWDTRLRRGEDYDAKWEYVRNNPVRHGLVAAADDWPYQGDLNTLPW